jgi:dienelactone hydrolase
MTLDDRLPQWLIELQTPPTAIPADATRPSPPLFDSKHQAIRTREAWESRRGELRRAWLEFLGEIGRSSVPPSLTVVEEDVIPGNANGAELVRSLVQYESEAGLPVEGYLLRRHDVAQSKPQPGVVVLHSTIDYTIRQPAGFEGPSDKHIGLQLARMGLVTFCPRNFLWQYGQAGRIELAVDWLRSRHPSLKGMAKMLFDASRAVDALMTLPYVDGRRIGAIGHSLGGKEALYLAAFDERIKAAVSSEGGIGLTYSNWEAPWYLSEAIQRPGFPLDHGQVLALIAPRAFLLIGGDSADGARSWPYIEAAMPVWTMLGAPEAVGLLNHAQGHEYPKVAQDRAGMWLTWFL